jgi:hypothetical protein
VTTTADLADRAAITDVIYRYAYGIDHGLPDMVLSCFSDNAYVEYDGQLNLEGIDQLRAVLTRPADR